MNNKLIVDYHSITLTISQAVTDYITLKVSHAKCRSAARLIIMAVRGIQSAHSHYLMRAGSAVV